MPNVTIRDISPEAHQQLKDLCKRNGCTLQAYLKQLIEATANYDGKPWKQVHEEHMAKVAAFREQHRKDSLKWSEYVARTEAENAQRRP